MEDEKFGGNKQEFWIMRRDESAFSFKTVISYPSNLYVKQLLYEHIAMS
jgi:hypothetical protein